MYNIATYETSYVTAEFAREMENQKKALEELEIISATPEETRRAVIDLFHIVGANMLTMSSETLAVLTSSLIRANAKRCA